MQVVQGTHLERHVCKCGAWKGELANPQRILEFCLDINSNHLGGNLLALFSFWASHKRWDQEPDCKGIDGKKEREEEKGVGAIKTTLNHRIVS